MSFVGMPQTEFKGASPNAHLLIGEMPAPAQLQTGQWKSTTLSIVVHAVVLGALFYAATHVRDVVNTANQVSEKIDLIFLPRAGPGGGGGGRPKDPEPPRKAEIVASKPVQVSKPIPKPSDVPTPQITVPVQTAQAVQTLPGTLSPIDTAGLGAGGGGRGTGIGTGNGSGVGPGEGGNIGGGLMQPGNGVSNPILIHEVKPNYTGDAMRAKLQGVVEMEVVVLADGTVDPSRLKITRSLDPTFGLDQQAVIAVRQWRFRPSMYKGQPVPVIVTVELTFTLR
jgi:protein TonB